MSSFILDVADTSAPYADYVHYIGLTIKHGWVFGGTNAVSAAAERSPDIKVSGQD